MFFLEVIIISFEILKCQGKIDSNFTIIQHESRLMFESPEGCCSLARFQGKYFFFFSP